MTGLPLIDLMREPALRHPVKPNGPTVRDPVDETLSLGSDLAWPQARIELHRDRASGLWMWSIWHQIEHRGGGYRVGPKWGRFTRNRAAALDHAIGELTDALASYDTRETRR